MFWHLGIITAFYASFVVLNLLYAWLRPSTLPRFLRRDRTSWALVTGASSGIGYGFCQELAARGFNIILHGRNREKLVRRASDLAREFPQLQTRIFVADASTAAAILSSDDALLEVVKGIHLTVLVNNVGGNDNLPRQFMNLQEQSLSEIEETVNLNLGFTTKLTRVLLPTLMANEPSLIINIGSLATLGVPGLTVYSGSKGFLVAFSESLQTELVMQAKDITVHAINVSSVISGGFEQTTTPSLLVPSSRAMASATLARVGCGAVAMTPYLPHALIKFLVSNLPRKLRQQALIAGARDAQAVLLSDEMKTKGKQN